MGNETLEGRLIAIEAWIKNETATRQALEADVQSLEDAVSQEVAAAARAYSRQRAVNEAMLTWLNGGIDSVAFRAALREALE